MMKRKGYATGITFGLVLLAGLAWGASAAQGQSAVKAQTGQNEARLARVFQDNMVLQREKPVPIWGWAKAGTKVEVSFAGQKKTATADEHGYWKAILDPLKANREGQVLTAQIGSTTVNCKNVLVGEVWLACGHSGSVAGGPNVDTGLYPRYDSPGTKGGKPEIRFFYIWQGDAVEPWNDLDPVIQKDAHWNTLKENPEGEIMNQIEYCSRVLRDKLDVPVGFLFPVRVAYLGEQWMSRETLESLPADDGAANCYEERKAMAVAAFKKAEAAYKGPLPVGQIAGYDYPSAAYNSKILPLAPYALRGVQFFCCPNVGTGGAPGIVALVKQWRKLFGQDFYFVNCASGYRVRTLDQPPLMPGIFDNPSEEAIYASLKLFGGEKREEIVNTKDLGSTNAHNFERAEAGRRLGLATLALVYGQKLPADGACPRMAETKLAGNKATVRFDFVGEGLVYQPSINGISGVYLRGKDGPGRWAQVKVIGKDTLEFSSSAISELVTVAYGENANSHETIFNSAGLPACPFVVNQPRTFNDPWSPYQILKMMKDEKTAKNAALKNAQISLAHVRRSGYVYQFVGAETIDNDMKVIQGVSNEGLENGSATMPMQAYIPAEWKGYEVVAGDKYDIRFVNGMPWSKGLVRAGWRPLKTTETTKDGVRFVNFDSPVDGTWVVVAEKGKAEGFRKINRY